MGGGDKGLLLLRGRPLMAHVIERLAPQCGPIAISANGDPGRFACFDLTVLADSVPDFPGPLAGILAGLDWAALQGFPAIVSAAADTPFLPPDLVGRLQQSAGGRGIALAAVRDASGELREHPTIGLWPVALRHDLRARLLQGQRRMRDLARDHGAEHVVWNDPPCDPFFNINTPDDLRRAAGIADGTI